MLLHLKVEDDKQESVVGVVESVALLVHAAPENDTKDAQGNHEKRGGESNEDVVLDFLEGLDHSEASLQTKRAAGG